MPRRAGPRAPEAFGKRLIELRRGRERSVIVKLLASKGLKIDNSTLHRYEKQRHMPTADIIVGLAKAYEQPFEVLLTLALSDLLGQSQRLQLTSTHTEGGAVDPAVAARLLELDVERLERLTAEQAARIREVTDTASDVVKRLADVLVKPEDRKTRTRQSGTRGRHRKTSG